MMLTATELVNAPGEISLCQVAAYLGRGPGDMMAMTRQTWFRALPSVSRSTKTSGPLTMVYIGVSPEALLEIVGRAGTKKQKQAVVVALNVKGPGKRPVTRIPLPFDCDLAVEVAHGPPSDAALDAAGDDADNDIPELQQAQLLAKIARLEARLVFSRAMSKKMNKRKQHYKRIYVDLHARHSACPKRATHTHFD